MIEGLAQGLVDRFSFESPFDRRHKMASVLIDTANAGAGQDAIAIPYLQRDVAEDIYGRLSAAAAETEFRW